MEIKEILLSALTQSTNDTDSESDNTDVIVELHNGKKYVAPFFAFRNIDKLVKVHAVTGEFLKGKYFHSHNMILIDECSEKNVREVVEHLIEEGEFLLVFKRISK